MDGFLMLICSAKTEAQMNCPTNPDCCDEPDFLVSPHYDHFCSQVDTLYIRWNYW